MATVQDQPKTTTAAKYDAFVETQLARARGRIRMLDVTTAGLGLLSGFLVFGLSMVLLDRWLVLSSLVRQVALAGFVVAALLYGGVVLFWLWSRRVNPYYAARQVEQTVPGAKNSLVNWLDLHTQKLPPAIRGALGSRAAKDLSHADLERAISGRQTLWMMVVTGLLVLATIVTFSILRPDPFFSLLGRAFAPFREGTIATRTRITIVQPAGSDAVVAINQPVTFIVQVQGRNPDANKPDAVKLLFRYNQTESVYEERRLDPVPNTGGEWTTRLPAYQVHNGFWYKITGGDFETPEYRVQVRSSPLLTGFDVTYHYRPYLRWRDSESHDGNLEAMRGTEVTIVARTNRTVKEGRLQIEGDAQPLAAKIDPVQPDALKFKFVMDSDGEYRIRFTSTEDEPNPEPLPYRIRVLRDNAPTVVLTAPAENVQLPANGVLLVLGKATDDIGLTSMTLRLRVKDGPTLQAKKYRDGTKFQLADGSYPRSLEYLDMIELDKVKNEKGEPFVLRAGMEVEFWLEATDNCDYPPPGPNVGQSERFIITITEPIKDEKKLQQERQEAKQARKEHEQKQDQQLKKENEAAQQRATEENQPPQKPMTKEEQEAATKEKEEQERLQKEFDQLKEAVKKKEEQEGGARGEGKNEGKQEPKGENKDKPENDAKGQDKPQPGQQAGKESGKGKDEGKPDAKGDKGQGKPDAKPHPGQENGDNKGQPQSGQQPGQGKNQGPPEAKPDQGKNDGSDKPSPKPDQLTGEGKNGGKAQPNAPKGEGKNNVQANTESSGKPGEAKGEDPSQAKGTGKKQPVDGGRGKDSQPGEAKSEGKLTAGNGQPKGDNKPADQEPANGSGVAKAESKDPSNKQPVAGDDKTGVGQEKAPTKEDVDRLAKKMKSNDPKEQEEGKQQLNEMVDRLRKKTKSEDPKEREEAKQQMQEMVQELAKEMAGRTPQEQQEALKRLTRMANQELAQNQNGNDSQKEKDAEEKLDRELSDKLNSGDPKKREEAAQQIKKMAEELKKNKKLQDAMKQAGLDSKDKNQPKDGDCAACASKGQPKDQGDSAGKGKNQGKGEQGTPKGDAKEPGDPDKGDNSNMAGKGKPGGSGPVAGESKPTSNAETGSTPGGGDRRDTAVAEAAAALAAALAAKAETTNPDNKKRPGELQLEDFRKKVTKEMLEKLKMTPKEFDDFCKAYKEKLQREARAPRPKEPLAGPQRGGSLTNDGPRRVDPGTTAKPDDLNNAGPALPPPELRNAYKEFTEELSKLKRSKK